MIFPCAKIGHFFNRDCQLLTHRKSVPIINVEALISNRCPSRDTSLQCIKMLCRSLPMFTRFATIVPMSEWEGFLNEDKCRGGKARRITPGRGAQSWCDLMKMRVKNAEILFDSDNIFLIWWFFTSVR
jgi:hypothetical protein